MKNIITLFGLTMLLLFTACKDKTVAQEVSVILPQEFEMAISNNKVQLLDVRTSEEFEAGHIQNAVNIDVLQDDFTSKIKDLDPKEPVYLYCRSGRRSEKASTILKGLGFEEIYDLKGGFLNWESEGLEVEK